MEVKMSNIESWNQIIFSEKLAQIKKYNSPQEQCRKCGVHIDEGLWCKKCRERVDEEMRGEISRPFTYYFKRWQKRLNKKI